MKKTISFLIVTAALAGCSLMPSFGDDKADAPVVAAAPTVAPTPAQPTPTTLGAYEIKDADRGLVRRVRVLHSGRTVDTIVFSRTRASSSSYCCTPDSCVEISAEAACAAFTMTCDKDGACVRAATPIK